MSFEYVLQRFVSPKESSNTSISSSKSSKCGEQGQMSGEEARTFYESVLSSSADRSAVILQHFKPDGTQRSRKREKEGGVQNMYGSCKIGTSDMCLHCNDDDGDSYKNEYREYDTRIKPLPVVSSSNQRSVHQFLKSAQDGKLRPMQELLSKHNLDIDVCDQFSWTALMCASHSGQLNVVEFLLEKGATWKTCKDSNGNTALDLARLANNFDVVDLLLRYEGNVQPKKMRTMKNETCPKRVKSWCSICEKQFSDSKKVHQGSTMHLFNTQRKPQRTFYYIPEENVGYQMMLKSGWNEDQGLGPEGIGRKFPIKTILKRDRQGLGKKGNEQARVTHFGPNDRSAVKRRKVNKKEKQRSHKPRKNSCKERIIKDKKEKNWERNMRLYMNSE